MATWGPLRAIHFFLVAIGFYMTNKILLHINTSVVLTDTLESNATADVAKCVTPAEAHIAAAAMLSAEVRELQPSFYSIFFHD